MEHSAVDRVKAVIQKVRTFKGLSVVEAAKLISICELRNFVKRETVWEAGDPTTELLVLVNGRLLTTSVKGTVLGHIEPGNTVGEIGMLSGRPRSANVIAEEASSGFIIQKRSLNALFVSDQKLKLKVYENLVAIMCDRLLEANARIEKLNATDDEM